eukprot:212930-Amphidinium_carterae.1
MRISATAPETRATQQNFVHDDSESTSTASTRQGEHQVVAAAVTRCYRQFGSTNESADLKRRAKACL